MSSALGSWFFFMRPYTWQATTYWNFCTTSASSCGRFVFPSRKRGCV